MSEHIDPARRKALEDAGFTVGDTPGFLGMSPDDAERMAKLSAEFYKAWDDAWLRIAKQMLMPERLTNPPQ